MNKAYLLTGGNMGQREANLAAARQLITEQGCLLTASSCLYETAAWGMQDQPAFLNQALEINTSLSSRQLLRRMLKIEKQIGRIRLEKYGPRVIDIDILLFNDEIHNYPLLKLPHPEMANRRFALTPLAEIAPDLIHPVLKKSIVELLEICPDTLPVKRMTTT
jgi:2-amino-4-hydroxy-6-hydroxymethyldihydropteridine diphosphokinase